MDLLVLVSSESSEALSVLSGDSLSWAAYGHLVLENKTLVKGREFVP